MKRLLLLALCCLFAAMRPAAADARPPASHRILILSSAAQCQGPADAALRRFVSDESSALAKALSDVARDAELTVLSDGSLGRPRATWDELQRRIRNDPRPLFIVYSGHGKRQRGESIICLSDRLVPISRLLSTIDRRVPRLTLLLNTCESAHVDVTRDSTVVISAGPNVIETNSTGTVINQSLLAGLAAGLDSDNDGMVTSHEVFSALARPYVGRRPVSMKLRAQAWGPLPLFCTGRGEPCPPPAAPAAYVWSAPEKVTLGAVTTWRYVRPLRPQDRAELAQRGLRARPCREETGQCFGP